MTPVTFPEANTLLGPPKGLVESQCATMAGYVGVVEKGSLEGSDIFVVAWLPNEKEMAQICNGAPILLTFIGGIPPHYPSTSFQDASQPS